jgi:tRNA wybutosine-synthesizing protein 2
MVRPIGPPAERVREIVRRSEGDSVADVLPTGFQRVGRVLLLRLPVALRPHHRAIGAAWGTVPGIETVLVHRGPIGGDRRLPDVEVIAGTGTETEVLEHGVRYRFDAARVLFSRGNEIERARAGEVTRPGETVVDLFAGIGYFVLPALLVGGAGRAYAVEENPTSYRYLLENLQANGVADRATALLGDNRSLELPVRGADRAFLGLLPSAVPWIPVALPLVRDGATLHVHLVVDARHDATIGITEVSNAVSAAGGSVRSAIGRRVKAYGPGRSHVVVDVVVTPPGA